MSQNVDAFSRIEFTLGGAFVAKCLQLTAKLGIADCIGDDVVSADKLAKMTHTNADALYRILRLVTNNGIFEEPTPRYFANNDASYFLRSDAESSLRDFASTFIETFNWEILGRLEESVYSGKANTNLYELLMANPELGERFGKAMSSIGDMTNGAVARSYDFSGPITVADIGGSFGIMLMNVLAVNPQARGVLFDVPPTIEMAKQFTPPQFAQRMEFVGGDYTQQVPAGADIYMMKGIMHNCSDALAIQCLETIRKAMRSDSRLLIISFVLPETNDHYAFPHLVDIQMLMAHDGRERTLTEFKNLLKKAGFGEPRVIETGTDDYILETMKI